MPTPLDRALNSKNTFLAFGGIVTAVAAWSIWGQDMFPKEADPSGDPETWTYEEMRRWLAAVSTLSSFSRNFTFNFKSSSGWLACSVPETTYDLYLCCAVVLMSCFNQRNLHPNSKDTKEQLLERVKANLRTPRV
ncbi:hypothetical protein VTL71DRAFT_15040 [Oculimacula yallundae]|uniref:Uncharacterized protein n=1 Tax=Oculimacula yallundae TaxID=86028 RepID=A0ABR4CGQ1_9HELO